jgi:hypothetical protein
MTFFQAIIRNKGSPGEQLFGLVFETSGKKKRRKKERGLTKETKEE